MAVAMAATPRDTGRRSPSCPTPSKTLGGTGVSLLSTAPPNSLDFTALQDGGAAGARSAPLTARSSVHSGGSTVRPSRGTSLRERAAARHSPPQLGQQEAESCEDPNVRDIAEAEAQFMSSFEKERVMSARTRYPRKAAPPKVDPLTGELDDTIPRRIAGFNVGFEKVFATTSMTLPIVAHSVFVELHAANDKQIFSRRFNGINTVLDIKKWVYEKLLVPMDAYDLSYAEPGKAAVSDELRLLTTQDSLDTRTLAATPVAHGMFRGVPGVHSIFDHGVTRLYVRLKCRSCGNIVNSLQSCRKLKGLGEIEVPAYTTLSDPSRAIFPGHTKLKQRQGKSLHDDDNIVETSVPGKDPAIEECWYRPDEKKHCLFHTRGYELFEAARTHSGGAEVARIYVCCGKEPSKKLGLFDLINLSKRAKKISY